MPFGGPEPTYSERVSPLEMSDPGILTTSQWCHSRNSGFALLGASGSKRKLNARDEHYSCVNLRKSKQ